MTLDSAATALTPPEFRFSAPTMSAFAYSIAFKSIAVGVVLVSAGWVFGLWKSGILEFGSSAAQQETGVIWLSMVLGLMAYTLWHILKSRTALASDGLRQSWLWDKQVLFKELAYIKLIRIPGLDWLIAPRVYTRNLSGKSAVFYVADHAMLAEVNRLVADYTHFRRTVLGM